MKKKSFKFSFFIFFIIPLFSQSQLTNTQLLDATRINAITTAVPFLGINIDSRSGGMGDAGTALSAGPTSIYLNTAAISFSGKEGEIGVAYVPWLRSLTNDMSVSYISGYKRFNKHSVGLAMRYFSLGNITFTDNSGNVLRDFKPTEFELVGGYAFKLSDHLSIGINGKYIYSNLTGGMVTPGAQSKAGVSGATDLSLMYQVSPDFRIGTTINNIGGKISYSSLSNSDFLPMSLKLGTAYTRGIDKYNKMTFSLDLQKMLVPTPMITSATVPGLLSPIGKSSSGVGVVQAILQSFTDAPGSPIRDKNDKLLKNADGTYQIEKGSRLKEELSEINIATGMEYNYNNTMAVRGGFFYESLSKGGRQFFTFGVGLKYNLLGFDISYIATLKRTNPLANTLRFSIRFDIGDKGK